MSARWMSAACDHRLGLGLGLRRRLERQLWTERPGCDLLVPYVGDRDLVVGGVAAAELDHLWTFPVSVPVVLGLEPRHLEDLVAVVVGTVHGVLRRAVAHRQRSNRGYLQG